MAPRKGAPPLAIEREKSDDGRSGSDDGRSGSGSGSRRLSGSQWRHDLLAALRDACAVALCVCALAVVCLCAHALFAWHAPPSQPVPAVRVQRASLQAIEAARDERRGAAVHIDMAKAHTRAPADMHAGGARNTSLRHSHVARGHLAHQPPPPLFFEHVVVVVGSTDTHALLSVSDAGRANVTTAPLSAEDVAEALWSEASQHPIARTMSPAVFASWVSNDTAHAQQLSSWTESGAALFLRVPSEQLDLAEDDDDGGDDSASDSETAASRRPSRAARRAAAVKRASELAEQIGGRVARRIHVSALHMLEPHFFGAPLSEAGPRQTQPHAAAFQRAQERHGRRSQPPAIVGARRHDHAHAVVLHRVVPTRAGLQRLRTASVAWLHMTDDELRAMERETPLGHWFVPVPPLTKTT